MKKAYFIIGLLFSCVIIYNCSESKVTMQNHVGNPYPTRIFDSTPSVEYLDPEQSLKSFNLPAGYHLELVASEPMIKEPVAIAWDGNAKNVCSRNAYLYAGCRCIRRTNFCKPYIIARGYR